MSQTLYPNGYGRQLITLDEMKARHGFGSPNPMLKEADRRLFNWIEAQGGKVGIGGGWRTTPHGVSQASRNGWSFHQDQTYPEGVFYHAVDLVCRADVPGERHRAPRWEEVPRQGSADADKWGVHCNIDHETWHMQLIEFDGYWTWVRADRPGPFIGYPIPVVGQFPPPVMAPPGLPAFRPELGEFSLWPVNPAKPRIAQADFVRERVEAGFDYWTSRGDAVKYLQAVIFHKAGGGIKIDGHFGPLSAQRVTDLQRWFDLLPDGLVGPQTWELIDGLSQT